MRTPQKSFRARRFASALLVAPLVLAACGGDDDADGEVAVSAPAAEESGAGADTPAATVAESDDADTGNGDAADRDAWVTVGADYLDGGDREFDECLSAGVVDGIGHETLAASGATPEEFWSASDITQFGIEVGDMDDVASRLTDCGDLVDYFSVVAGGTDAQVACMREFFDDDDVAEVIVVSMLGAEPDGELLAKQTEMRACAEEAGG